MPMTSAQSGAWSIGAGGGEPSVLNNLITGTLFVVLFLIAAWALVSLFRGWRSQAIDTETMGSSVLRFILLLVICLFFFAN
ncbi:MULTISPECIES: TIGR03758 family integrating conjugative element protein [Dickeya]|uniref:TIGR03758 family integrating conjugative element protein n=1 Tax=Dickeya oryzae TaxID=1240404 RepID=A0AB39ISI3_9GAMM|nr:TIGR03758 family integrating conjugative element protein [Dickeya oryzae]MCA6990806.1 TIGR03758 family integrating conjugative element protein [Dickeya oryzae]